MPIIPVENLEDPRIADYHNLKGRVLSNRGNRFITESRRLVLRMLASDTPTESILLTEDHLPEVEPHVPADTPVYVVTKDLMTQIAGFEIHTGVLAVGRRKPWTSLDSFFEGDKADAPMTFLVCPQIKEPSNLGAMTRVVAALGLTGLILGPHCCDPYYRRAVRVSMGTVFRVPIRRSDDLVADLTRMRDVHQVELAATVLAPDAELLHLARRPGPPDRLAILLGHEVFGLPQNLIDLCQRKLTIPMHLGTDSLNVSVSAALFLYHFIHPTDPIRLPEAEQPEEA